MRRSAKGSSCTLALSLLLNFNFSQSAADTVVLDPIPVGTVTGTVGLTGETFGNGQVYSSTSGLGYSAAFASAGNFSVTTGAESVFSLTVYMYQFQNTPGAQLRQTVYNQPALAEGETRSLDLRRNAGRVSGSVAITGGTVESISLNASSNNSAVPESFNGSVSVGAQPFVAVLPMPVVPGTTTVNGSVTILSNNGCRTARSLPSRSVTVLAGAEVAVQWTVDVSMETCSTGTLQGSVTTSGLTGVNADALESYRYVDASGPDYRYVYPPAGQSNFLFENLRVGSYSVGQGFCYAAPYSCYYPFSQGGVQVNAGQVTQYSRNLPLATAHGTLYFNGAWGLDDLSYAYVQARNDVAPGGYPYDYLDLSSGRFDFVMPAGTSYLYNYTFQDNTYDPATGDQSHWYTYENRNAGSRVSITVGEGGRAQLDAETIETSVASQTFEVAQQDGQPEARINRLSVSGNGYVRDPVTNATLATRYLQQDDSRTPSRTFNMSLRGLPGTYQMQARGYGTDGRQYTAAFQVIFGVPNDTPAGANVETPFADASGNVLGTLTFDQVLQGGDTTVSQTTLGPDAPPNFKIFKAGNDKQYFDVSTTALFDGFVELCIKYKDTDLSDPDKEDKLELAHYNEATGDWDPITNPDSPDTVNNVICGMTDSFSTFAILEEDIVDTDLDGLRDDVDNCPATANLGQQDFDADGIGDACDTDTDGDSLPDATDLCPNFAHPDNGDMDGDSTGDPCDGDVDGDSARNAVDNCPLAANADQTDFDFDGAGDECDVDDDGDVVQDATDDCPGTELGTVIDARGCASPQRLEAACPVRGVYRNHGQYVSCVAKEADAQIALGLISSDDKGVIVSTAAHTTVATAK